MHDHALRGCTPTPLAGYLKSLGILRLVGEQIDPRCTGYWANNTFHLSRRHLQKMSLRHFSVKNIYQLLLFPPGTVEAVFTPRMTARDSTLSATAPTRVLPYIGRLLKNCTPFLEKPYFLKPLGNSMTDSG